MYKIKDYSSLFHVLLIFAKYEFQNLFLLAETILAAAKRDQFLFVELCCAAIEPH